MIERTGKKCIGCGACESVCPSKCIEMRPDSEGFLFPAVDRSKCISCEQCDRICPVLTDNKPCSIFDSKIYGAHPRKRYEHDVKLSASAGVFYFLAYHFVRNDGYVFGAVYDEDFRVRHVMARTMNEVIGMQNSKYVQSDTRGIYSTIKGILSGDPLAYVIFSGTPCQCLGLRSYLGEDYTNLLIVDVVCHGVPSPLAFEKYLSYLSEKRKEPVSDFQFRYKLKGWNYKGYMSSYVKFNHHFWSVVRDPYMTAFLKKLNYRECCYSCVYNTNKKTADMTLADFAGIRETAPDFFSSAGCSLIYIQNDKGESFLEKIKPYIETLDLSFEQNGVYGKILTDKRTRGSERDEIYKNISTLSDIQYVRKRLNKYLSVKSIVRFYMPFFARKLIRRYRNS